MPTYRVLINQKATGDYVISPTREDAYFDIASSMALTYEDTVQLEEVNSRAYSMADQDL